MKKGKKSIVTVILAFILAVAGGVIYDNEGEAPQESSQQVEVLQESQQEAEATGQTEADLEAEAIGQTEADLEAEAIGQTEADIEDDIDESEDTVTEETVTDESEEIEFAVEEEELTFRKESNLTSHYEKHGIEMGFDSAEEYLEAANAVVNNPDSLHKLEAEDGDDVYYLEATNEFVVVSKDGYIRTYFNPSDGLDYFNRQ